MHRHTTELRRAVLERGGASKMRGHDQIQQGDETRNGLSGDLPPGDNVTGALSAQSD